MPFQKGNTLGKANKGRKVTWGDKVSQGLKRAYQEGRCEGFQPDHPFLGNLSNPNHFQKGHIPWNKGHHKSTARRRKLHKDVLWRQAIFERDNYTCQYCGARNGNGKTIYFEAHHIKSYADYPDLRYELDNGITLCKECHSSTKCGNPSFK